MQDQDLVHCPLGDASPWIIKLEELVKNVEPNLYHGFLADGGRAKNWKDLFARPSLAGYFKELDNSCPQISWKTINRMFIPQSISSNLSFTSPFGLSFVKMHTSRRKKSMLDDINS